MKPELNFNINFKGAIKVLELMEKSKTLRRMYYAVLAVIAIYGLPGIINSVAAITALIYR